MLTALASPRHSLALDTTSFAPQSPMSTLNFPLSILEAAAPLGPRFYPLSTIVRGPTLCPSSLASQSDKWEPVILRTLPSPPEGLPLHITPNVAFLKWRHTVADLLLDRDVASSIEHEKESMKQRLRAQMDAETPGLSDILISARRRSPSPPSSVESSPRMGVRPRLSIDALKSRTEQGGRVALSATCRTNGLFAELPELPNHPENNTWRWRASVSN